jgi:hypothetical protein
MHINDYNSYYSYYLSGHFLTTSLRPHWNHGECIWESSQNGRNFQVSEILSFTQKNGGTSFLFSRKNGLRRECGEKGIYVAIMRF